MTRKQEKRRQSTYAHPMTLNEHSEYRWWKRHRSAWPRDLAVENLRKLMTTARLVEVDEANMQAIWALPSETGYEPLLVVDTFGLVRTVLPRNARYDKEHAGHPPKLPRDRSGR